MSKKDGYDQELTGIYGRFIDGAGCEIFYLQTAIQPDELAMIILDEVLGVGKHCWDQKLSP